MTKTNNFTWKDEIVRRCQTCKVTAPSPGLSNGWLGLSVTNSEGNKAHAAYCPKCAPIILERIELTKS